MLQLLRKFLDTSKKDIVNLQPTLKEINDLEPTIQALTDDGLKAKAAEFRTRAKGGEDLDKMLPEVFAELDLKKQEELLKAAEGGKLKFDDLSAKLFFTSLLNETRNGYFSDPKHGGNKDMGAWKMIGYPGMRGDYLDWVAVRDKPYPIGPVDLSGKRG